MRLLDFLKSLLTAFERAPRLLRDCAVLALVALIAWADYAIPAYIFLTGFYFLPIYLAIWYCGRVSMAFAIAMPIGVTLYMTEISIPPGASLWHSALAYASLIITFVGIATLMFYLRLLFRRLEDEHQTDALTGLRSRRNVLEMLQLELSRVARSGNPLTLALVDLDNFKHVNDTQGHAVGDALLVAASGCMKSVLRGTDIIGRLGGDEFLILLPATNVSIAAAVLDRLYSGLKPLLKSYSERTSASIGAVTVMAGAARSATEVLEKVDEVMYSVKHASKDAVVVEALA